MARHCTVYFSRDSADPMRLLPGSGAVFVNGQQVMEETKLRHNDRLILGNAQAFRVVDPLDPEVPGIVAAAVAAAARDEVAGAARPVGV